MQGSRTHGIRLKLKRIQSGLPQKTLGILLGGAAQALISWWESGRYKPGDCYMHQINLLLALDPLAEAFM